MDNVVFELTKIKSELAKSSCDLLLTIITALEKENIRLKEEIEILKRREEE